MSNLFESLKNCGRNEGYVYLISKRYNPEDYDDIEDFVKDVIDEYKDTKGWTGENVLIELNCLPSTDDRKELAEEVDEFANLYMVDFSNGFTGDYRNLSTEESDVETDEYDGVDDDDFWWYW